MKTLIIYIPIIFWIFSGENKSTDIAPESQDLTGAWQLMSQNGEVVSERRIRIITNSYFSEAGYDISDKEFYGALAGTFEIDGNSISETLLANTWNPEKVGTTESFEWNRAGNTLRKNGHKNGRKWMETWMRVEADKKYELTGAWRISGRMRNGELVKMPDRPRKTLKILSENRFQWIALNSETKEFFGTGGGTYEVIDGKYTEHIEFFSRDSSRVGMSLSFDITLDEKGWRHSGFGSTGNPVDEIWINVDKK